MPDSPVFSHANGTAPRGLDRRGAVRYPCSLAADCVPVPEAETLCALTVQDVFPMGVGLIADRFVEPETFLALDLQSEDQSLAYTLLVQVRHAQPREGPDWFLGCVFARPLSEHEVRALL
jgi:hypothetical protein